MYRSSMRYRVFGLVLVLGIFLSVAGAQSRKSVQLRGNLMVGQGPSTWNTSNMLTYSTGTEVLAQPQPSAGYTGALGSSIYQPQSMSYNIGSVAPPPEAVSHTPISSAPTHRRLYTPSTPAPAPVAISAPMPSAGGATYVSSFTGSPSPRRNPADEQAMLRQLEQGRQQALENTDTPITTLVPETAGEYKYAMSAGETAFKAGKYDEALKNFQQARMKAPSVPGAMIGCMMAEFAKPQPDYTKAADSLAQTLQAFPELPLVNLPPRGYFASGDEFDAALNRLAEFVKTNPNDAAAQFLMSYMCWRDGQFDPAEAAITVALEHSQSASLTKAMETFIRNVDKTQRKYKGKLAALAPVQAYPWAGVELALPDGFAIRRADRAFDVVVAGKGGTAEQPDELVGLYAFGVGGDITTGGFVTSILEQFQSNPKVQNLQEIDRGTGMIGDCIADARILQYDYQGRHCRSAAVCFIRAVKLPGQPAGAPPVRIAYLLTAEVPEVNKDDLLSIIIAVARTIKFTDLKRPIDLALEPGPVVEDRDVGVAVSPPALWSAAVTPDGVLMGQMDYVLGGVASPLAQANCVEIAEPLTQEQTVEQIVAREQAKGYTVTLLEQGPASLGKLKGYQIVLRKQVSPQGVKDARLKDVKAAQPLAKPGPPFIEVIRFSVQPRENGKTRGYFIGMSCVDADANQAKAVMDVLAKPFQPLDKNEESSTE